MHAHDQAFELGRAQKRSSIVYGAPEPDRK
jgi:hypothetical protein